MQLVAWLPPLRRPALEQRQHPCAATPRALSTKEGADGARVLSYRLSRAPCHNTAERRRQQGWFCCEERSRQLLRKRCATYRGPAFRPNPSGIRACDPANTRRLYRRVARLLREQLKDALHLLVAGWHLFEDHKTLDVAQFELAKLRWVCQSQMLLERPQPAFQTERAEEFPEVCTVFCHRRSIYCLGALLL